MLFPSSPVSACCTISYVTGLPAVLEPRFLLPFSHDLHVNLLDSFAWLMGLQRSRLLWPSSR